MTFLDYLYNNPDDVKRKLNNPESKSVFEDYITFMETQLLELEIKGLTPVTAQIALIELRNTFFNQVDKKDPSYVIESILQKPFDKNSYSAGIEDILKEYIRSDINANLGMSFPEWLKVPYFMKKSLLDVIEDVNKSKSKNEKKEMEKREKALKDFKGGK